MEQQKVTPRSRASHPGGVRLSRGLLKEFHPELLSWWEWKLHLLGARSAYEERGAGVWVCHFARRLRRGDGRAAVVVSAAPDVVVAAYTDELDCVALLEFDQRAVRARRLKEGDRLLTVNTYETGPDYAPDLEPGPRALGRYTNFAPLIADFLTSDAERVRRRKEEISEDEWERAWQLGRDALASGQTMRFGLPMLSGSSAPGKQARPPYAARKARQVLGGLAAFVGLLLIFAACLALIGWRVAARPSYVARDMRNVRRPGKVLLVPLNDFPAATLEELARHYAERYGTPVEVKPHARTPPAAYDGRRGQLVAQEAVAALRREYAAAPGEPQDVLIGVTAEDLYIRGVGWRYAFSYRHKGAAVVSTARMGQGTYVFLPDVGPEQQLSRLRKMVAKNIGVLYYRLPLSDDPRSVLYSDITSPQGLDRMGEDF